MQRALSVVAIVAARNEADIIHQTVGDLVRQGIGVYVIDHESSDGTADTLAGFAGHGLIGIERFSTAAGPPGSVEPFSLARILARKEQLAQELDADWYINHDADEFRESPWRHLNLRQGIELVDRLGYNAIDFALLNFWPTHDGFRPEIDIRGSFAHYEAGADSDRVQIRCWKRTGAPVDLVSSGGHEAAFEGRRVFPIRFLLRHYPIRNQAHGRYKVFEDRLPRFDPAERERGWHVQYDALAPDHTFVRSAGDLSAYDPDAVRVDLHLDSADAVSKVADRVTGLTTELGEQRRRGEALQADLEAERAKLRDTADRLAMSVARTTGLEGEVATMRHERDHLRRLVAALHESASWRLTAPLRAVWLLVTGRRNQP